jgi:hypothetical protein
VTFTRIDIKKLHPPYELMELWKNLLKKYRAQPPPEEVNNDEAKLLLSS